MKRLLVIVMILSFVISTACAEPDASLLFLKYNSFARVIGAPDLYLKDSRVVSSFEENDTIYLDCGSYDIGFIFDSDNNCTAVGANLYDESASETFLFVCMAVITACGEIDTNAYGMLLMQYAYARTGKAMEAYGICGSDAFSLHPVDGDRVYTFTYMNTDLALSN